MAEEKATAETTEETTGLEAKETKETAIEDLVPIAKPGETAEAEETTEEAEETTETAEAEEVGLEEFQEPKSGHQKAIDRLRAEKQALEDRVAQLETKDKTSKEPEYTDSQLKSALRKAINEGDADVVWEIIDYKNEQTRKSLRKEYTDAQTQAQEAQQRAQKEWTTLVESYDYLADPDESELYKGSRQELNLRSASSALYQLALNLYNATDPELWKYYHQPGGQKLAVADALAMILKKRRGLVPKDKEKDKLKKQLAKERRKKSLAGEGAIEEETTPKKPMTERERLDSYIAERKKTQSIARDSFGIIPKEK